VDRDSALEPRFSVREALAKAVAIRRELGWRVLFWRVLGAIGIRRVVLFRRDVDLVARRPPIPEAVSFDRLRREAAGEYLEFRLDADPSELARRLDAGDDCHIARANGRIVSARWSSRREVRIAYLGYASALAPGQAYLYGAYTAPAFRQRGIAGELSRHAVAVLHEEGVRELLSAADPANPAGTGFNRSTGTPIATLVAIGRRRQRHLTLRPPRPSSRRWLKACLNR
jgi:ribosomal protein S18 acetylase RimI-like enzyme